MSVVMNRAAWRELDRDIGKDACILCAAIAERSCGIVGEEQLKLAFHDIPKEARSKKIEHMRQWIKDFDAGKIVLDGEENEA